MLREFLMYLRLLSFFSYLIVLLYVSHFLTPLNLDTRIVGDVLLMHVFLVLSWTISFCLILQVVKSRTRGAVISAIYLIGLILFPGFGNLIFLYAFKEKL